VTSILHTLNPSNQIELLGIVCALAVITPFVLSTVSGCYLIGVQIKILRLWWLLLFARLWRVDCVTRRVCDELTNDELTVWQRDRVTRWLVAFRYRPRRLRGMSYTLMLSAANLTTTLASRRDEMSKKFFVHISETTSCLHHLLPDPRDHAIISRLRTNENRPLLECSLVYGNRDYKCCYHLYVLAA